MWQNIKGKFHHNRSWSSAKLFIMQNYTNNANGGMPSTIKMCGIFNFFEFSVHTFFWEEKEN